MIKNNIKHLDRRFDVLLSHFKYIMEGVDTEIYIL